MAPEAMAPEAMSPEVMAPEAFHSHGRTSPRHRAPQIVRVHPSPLRACRSRARPAVPLHCPASVRARWAAPPPPSRETERAAVGMGGAAGRAAPRRAASSRRARRRPPRAHRPPAAPRAARPSGGRTIRPQAALARPQAPAARGSAQLGARAAGGGHGAPGRGWSQHGPASELEPGVRHLHYPLDAETDEVLGRRRRERVLRGQLLSHVLQERDSPASAHASRHGISHRRAQT
jgi:hypothetical protein